MDRGGDGPAMLKRAARAWGRSERRLRPLVKCVLARFAADAPQPDVATLTAFLQWDRNFNIAYADAAYRQETVWLGRNLLLMAPRRDGPRALEPPATWNVPALPNPRAPGRLARPDAARAGLVRQDCQGRTRLAPPGPLHHYTYRWLRGRRGQARLLEMPRTRLKALQRRLLHELLERIPPHEAAHGFRRGRSIVTYVAAARQPSGRAASRPAPVLSLHPCFARPRSPANRRLSRGCVSAADGTLHQRGPRGTSWRCPARRPDAATASAERHLLSCTPAAKGAADLARRAGQP